MCLKCELKRDIRMLQERCSDIYYLLPLCEKSAVRAECSSLDLGDVPNDADRELVLLYRKKDQLNMQLKSYQDAAIRSGLIKR